MDVRMKLTIRGIEYACDYDARHRQPKTYFIEWNDATKQYDRVQRPPLWPKMIRVMSDAWQFKLVIWRFGFYAYDPHERSWVGAVYRWFERRHAHG
jgi:hypothetical protein